MAECTFSPKIDRRSDRMLSGGAQRCYPPPRDFTAGMAAAPAHAGAKLAGTVAPAGVGAGNQCNDDSWIEIAPGSSIEEIAALCVQGPATVSSPVAQRCEQRGADSNETGVESIAGSGQSKGSSNGSRASDWERQSELCPGSRACAAPLPQPAPIRTRQPHPPSAEVQLAACRRLHAHAVNMQQRQRAAKASLAKQELEAAQRASPRIKALPSFYRHTASSAGRAHRGRDGGRTFDDLDAAAATGQSPQAVCAEEDAALLHTPGYWARHKLNAAPDFGAFLERQQRHLEQSRAKLELRRAAPPPPPPAPSPGTVRLLAAMEQRAAAAPEADIGGGVTGGSSLLRRPGSAATAFAHGIETMLRPGSASAAPASPSSPALAGPPCQQGQQPGAGCDKGGRDFHPLPQDQRAGRGQAPPLASAAPRRLGGAAAAAGGDSGGGRGCRAGDLHLPPRQRHGGGGAQPAIRGRAATRRPRPRRLEPPPNGAGGGGRCSSGRQGGTGGGRVHLQACPSYEAATAGRPAARAARSWHLACRCAARGSGGGAAAAAAAGGGGGGGHGPCWELPSPSRHICAQQRCRLELLSGPREHGAGRDAGGCANASGLQQALNQRLGYAFIVCICLLVLGASDTRVVCKENPSPAV